MHKFCDRIAHMSQKLLELLPDAYRKTLVLRTLYGVANSYVRGPRGRNRGATRNSFDGWVQSARRSGAVEEEIQDAIRRAITDPPNAIPELVEETRRRFLT